MHLPLLGMTTLSAAFGHINAAAIGTRATKDEGLRAMIYAGQWACDGCPDSIEDLLGRVYPNLNVTYVDEADQINAQSLKQVDVFAYGGGDSEYLSAACEHVHTL